MAWLGRVPHKSVRRGSTKDLFRPLSERGKTSDVFLAARNSPTPGWKTWKSTKNVPDCWQLSVLVPLHIFAPKESAIFSFLLPILFHRRRGLICILTRPVSGRAIW